MARVCVIRFHIRIRFSHMGWHNQLHYPIKAKSAKHTNYSLVKGAMIGDSNKNL